MICNQSEYYILFLEGKSKPLYKSLLKYILITKQNSWLFSKDFSHCRLIVCEYVPWLYFAIFTIFSLAPKVARDIKWTKNLNKVFIENFELFPDLSWQYFGSAEGIHRQYPGKWFKCHLSLKSIGKAAVSGVSSVWSVHISRCA